MRYVIKKSENPYKGLKLKECSNLSGEMSDCQTSEKTDDMFKIDVNTDEEVFMKCRCNDMVFEDYIVSNFGEVWSFKGQEPRRLKPFDNGHGYLQVMLRKDGKNYPCTVHKLVMHSFVKELPNNYRELDINHRNEIKTDNRLSNLEFMTHKENMRYGTRTERTCKTCYQFDLQGNLIKTWSSLTEVNRELGFSQGYISQCCNGKAKTAYNYKWSYQPNLD